MVPRSPDTGDRGPLKSAGDSLFDAAIQMQTIQNCMIAQGWTLKS
jgi:hypothetical protein